MKADNLYTLELHGEILHGFFYVREGKRSGLVGFGWGEKAGQVFGNESQGVGVKAQPVYFETVEEIGNFPQGLLAMELFYEDAKPTILPEQDRAQAMRHRPVETLPLIDGKSRILAERSALVEKIINEMKERETHA